MCVGGVGGEVGGHLADEAYLRVNHLSFGWRVLNLERRLEGVATKRVLGDGDHTILGQRLLMNSLVQQEIGTVRLHKKDQ